MKLFNPLTIGTAQLLNRIVMAPLTRSRANNAEHAPTDLHVSYYTQRSSAGLIISEGTVVSPQGVGYMDVPGIYSQIQVQRWMSVTRAVHQNGGHIFCQLWHVGRISHPEFHGGNLPVAPSAINPGIELRTPIGKLPTVTPHELTVKEIKQVVNDFKQSAKNALDAGFDGVEIHASNGYLFHQFFSNSSNIRTDEYGGSRENKTRFLFEVLEAIASVCPVEKIGIRLNPLLHESGGIRVDKDTIPTFDYLVDRLNDYQLAYVHISRPFSGIKSPFEPANVINHYRQIYKGILLANGNFNAEEGEIFIERGYADAIVFGRLFISNPDLPFRIQNQIPLSEPDVSTFYTPGPKGYTDYPMSTQK